MSYALFKHGKQISKAHSTILACWIEAFEAGAVCVSRGNRWLASAFTIEAVQ